MRSSVCVHCIVDTDYLLGVAPLARHGVCARCGRLATHEVADEVLVEVGQAWWSPCRALAPIRLWVWDTNGFYRSLGVSPEATRREIGVAYREKGGPNDAWLTYAVGVLLDPATRRVYDALVPPNLWRDDPRVRLCDSRREWEAVNDLISESQVPMEVIDELIEEVLGERASAGDPADDLEDSSVGGRQAMMWGAMLLRPRIVNEAVVRAWFVALVEGLALYKLDPSAPVAIVVSGMDLTWRVAPMKDGYGVIIPDTLEPDESTVDAVCKALHKTIQERSRKRESTRA